MNEEWGEPLTDEGIDTALNSQADAEWGEPIPASEVDAALVSDDQEWGEPIPANQVNNLLQLEASEKLDEAITPPEPEAEAPIEPLAELDATPEEPPTSDVLIRDIPEVVDREPEKDQLGRVLQSMQRGEMTKLGAIEERDIEVEDYPVTKNLTDHVYEATRWDTDAYLRGVGFEPGVVTGLLDGVSTIATGALGFTAGMAVSLGIGPIEWIHKEFSEGRISEEDSLKVVAKMEDIKNLVMEEMTMMPDTIRGQKLADGAAYIFTKMHEGADALAKKLELNEDATKTLHYATDLMIVTLPKIGKTGFENYKLIEKKIKNKEGLSADEMKFYAERGEDFRNTEVIEQANTLAEERRIQLEFEEEYRLKQQRQLDQKLLEAPETLTDVIGEGREYEPTAADLRTEVEIQQRELELSAKNTARIEELKAIHAEWARKRAEERAELDFELGSEAHVRSDIRIRKAKDKKKGEAEPTDKNYPKVEPEPVTLSTQVTDHVLYAEKEVATERAKLYNEPAMLKRVSSDPETAVNKLINDVSRSVHGDKTVDMPGTRLVLQSMLDSAEQLGLSEYVVKQAEAGLNYARKASGKKTADHSTTLNMAVDPTQFYPMIRDVILKNRKLVGHMNAKYAKKELNRRVGRAEMINSGVQEFLEKAESEGRKVTAEEINAIVRPLKVRTVETTKYAGETGHGRVFKGTTNYKERLYSWDEPGFEFADPHFGEYDQQIVMNSRTSMFRDTYMLEEMQSKYWAESKKGLLPRDHFAPVEVLKDAGSVLEHHLTESGVKNGMFNAEIMQKIEDFREDLREQVKAEIITEAERKEYHDYASLFAALDVLRDNKRFSQRSYAGWTRAITKALSDLIRARKDIREVPFEKSWQNQIMLSELVEAAKNPDAKYFGWATAETVSMGELGIDLRQAKGDYSQKNLKKMYGTSSYGSVENYLKIYDKRGVKEMGKILHDKGIKAEIERVEQQWTSIVKMATLRKLADLRGNVLRDATIPESKATLKSLSETITDMTENPGWKSSPDLDNRIQHVRARVEQLSESLDAPHEVRMTGDHAAKEYTLRSDTALALINLRGKIHDHNKSRTVPSHYRVKMTDELREKLVGKAEKHVTDTSKSMQLPKGWEKDPLLDSLEMTAEDARQISDNTLPVHHLSTTEATTFIDNIVSWQQNAGGLELRHYMDKLTDTNVPDPIRRIAAKKVARRLEQITKEFEAGQVPDLVEYKYPNAPKHGVYLNMGLDPAQLKQISAEAKQILKLTGEASRMARTKEWLGDKFSAKGIRKDVLTTGERWWDISAASKDLLERHGTETADRAARLLSLRNGASTAADMHTKRMRHAVYGGISRSQRSLVDQVMALKRVVAIDKQRAAESIKTGKYRKVNHGKYTKAEMKAEGLEGKPIELNGITASHALAEMERVMGKDAFAQINARTEMGFQVMQDMLRMALEEGVINPWTYNTLKDIRYIPRKNLLDKLDPITTHQIGKTKITVRESGIQALKKGESHDRFVKDSELLMTEVIHSTYGRIAANKANRMLKKMASESPDNGFVMIPKKAGKDGKLPKPPKNWSSVDFFVDGKKERLFLRNDFARGWLQGNKEVSYKLGRNIELVSASMPVKVTAVAWNWGFGLVNLFYDMFHNYMAPQMKIDGKWTGVHSPMLPKYMGQYAMNMARVGSDAVMRRGRWHDAAYDGMGMKFMAQEGRIFRKHAIVQTSFDRFQEMLGWVGETSEIAGRLNVREQVLMKRAKELGIEWSDFIEANRKLRPTIDKNGKMKTNPEAKTVDPTLAAQIGLMREEAAFAARDHLDFGNRGSVGGFVDKAFPFWNAATQATRGLFKAAKRNPKQFGLKLGQLGTVAAGIYFYNTHDKDRHEAYKKVPDFIKKGNFIYMTDVVITDAYGEKQNLFIKIPKDPSQRYFTAAFEAVVGLMMGHEVDIPGVQEFANTMTPMEGVLPVMPSVDMILGAAVNFDLQRSMWDGKNVKVWKGGELPEENISEEIRVGYGDSDTPAWAVAMGEMYGISPVRLQHSLESVFARGPITTLTSTIANRMLGDTQSRDMVWGEALTKFPIARRFFGLTSTEDQEMRKEDYEIKNQERLKDFRVDQEVKKMMYGYFVNKTVSLKELQALKQKYPKYRKKIQGDIDFELSLKKYGVGNRSLWRRMRGTNDPEAQARMYYQRYSKSAGDDNARLNLELARRQLGFTSERFVQEFVKIRLHDPERVKEMEESKDKGSSLSIPKEAAASDKLIREHLDEVQMGKKYKMPQWYVDARVKYIRKQIKEGAVPKTLDAVRDFAQLSYAGSITMEEENPDGNVSRYTKIAGTVGPGKSIRGGKAYPYMFKMTKKVNGKDVVTWEVDRGYGEKIKAGIRTKAEAKRLVKSTPVISQEKAVENMHAHLEKDYKAYRKKFPNMSRTRAMLMATMAYQGIRPDTWKKSGPLIAKAVKSGKASDWIAVGKEMRDSDWWKKQTKRRAERMIKLFVAG